jgi:hypothetical protein
MTQPPQSAEAWNRQIDEALACPDPFLANFKITRLHYLLSAALIDAIGHAAGSNFHTWAVWGSRKAGVTIRQEDKDQASRDGMLVAGIVGATVGVGVGAVFATWLNWPWLFALASWMVTGLFVGGYCGRLLANYTRSRAAQIILQGNQIVLDDIGRVSAAYLDYLQQIGGRRSDCEPQFATFLHGLRPGKTEHAGQDLLRQAFTCYEQARRKDDPQTQHEQTYFANCLAVLHEHIRLQPYIRRSLPFLISRCVTQRLMTYSVGEQLLAVHEDVPPLGDTPFPATLTQLQCPQLQEFLTGPQGWDRARGTFRDTRAKDWTNIHERMGYIVNLFRSRHLDPAVFAPPYATEQLSAIAAGQLPSRPW